ncbi:17-beta-hydroxysteroid dehydrogenase type 1-like [Apostichopus japonicus]|uniref:17-beta-hydroxysteroid dehydrogenase type 1-like n=1 Tax=Stichopus japonicus TaxID=307972 RepID=UPI003AB32F02
MGERQIVLVTNCEDDTGFSTALKFAQDKEKRYKVWAAVTDKNYFHILQKGVENLVDDTLFIIEMAMEMKSIEESVKDILQKDGHIDILVINSLKLGAFGLFEEQPFDCIYPIFETNVFGPCRLLQLLIPGMKRRQMGRILIVSSSTELEGGPFTEYYSSSISALEHICLPLSIVVRKNNVLLSVIQSSALASPAVEWIVQFSRDFTPASHTDPKLTEMMKNRLDYIKGRGTGSNATTIDTVSTLLKMVAEDPSPCLMYSESEHVEKLAENIFVDYKVKLEDLA